MMEKILVIVIFQVVGALQAAQYIRCKSVMEDGVCRNNDYTGYEIAMMESLRKALNFSYEIVIAPDGNWGKTNQSGFWNGLVGMASRGDVDFVIGSVLISFNKFQALIPRRMKPINCSVD